MNKVAIRNTTKALTIVRKTTKTVILKTDVGPVEVGTFPLTTEVKVLNLPFNPNNYGEDTEFHAKRALDRKITAGWVVFTGDRSLHDVVSDRTLRVGNKYQIVVLIKPAVV
jgi:hypothetical protein